MRGGSSQLSSDGVISGTGFRREEVVEIRMTGVVNSRGGVKLKIWTESSIRL